MYDNDLVDSMLKIGKYLKIKQHPLKGRSGNISGNTDIPLSQNLIIYKVPKFTLESLVVKINHKVKDSMQKLNIKTGDPNDKHVYYIRSADSIFPVDIDVTQKNRPVKQHRLRPEFLREYPKKLNPDTLIQDSTNKQLDYNDIELSEASKSLLNKNVKALLHALDSMENLPMDSNGISKVFHEFGVNLRYIGTIAKNTKLPHIKEFLIAEMIARSTRKILDKETTQLILKAGQI